MFGIGSSYKFMFVFEGFLKVSLRQNKLKDGNSTRPVKDLAQDRRLNVLSGARSGGIVDEYYD